MSETLWCINIQGPDDVVAVASYLDAVRLANSFNIWWWQLKTEQPLTENDPRMWAVPIEWMYSAESHAESVANPSPEYAEFLTQSPDFPAKARP